MKNFIFLFLIIFGFLSVSAQERYVKPFDEAKKDASFLAFRSKLIAAAKKSDVKYVLSIIDPNIKNGFGGDDGIANFKKSWKINSPKSEFWNEFLTVITNGGKFDETNKKLFVAPYSFNSFPDDVDVFSNSVIFGNNVNLRSKPDTNSTVVAGLSYNIVEILNSVKDKNDIDKIIWFEVKTLGGKRGFVSADFVRSPIDYRAGFEKIRGVWRMTFFLAGD